MNTMNKTEERCPNCATRLLQNKKEQEECNNCRFISSSHIPKYHKRTILHVIVGNKKWKPATEQLNEVADLFIAADKDPQRTIVTTCEGIKTKLINLENNTGILINPTN